MGQLELEEEMLESQLEELQVLFKFFCILFSIHRCCKLLVLFFAIFLFLNMFNFNVILIRFSTFLKTGPVDAVSFFGLF